LRVNIVYKNLTEYLKNSTSENIGTDMDGTNFYEYDFPEKFNLILGNEGNGIRPETENLITQKITIPRFGKSTESLNVSIAAGIILGQIFSKKF
ncbi:MAG TPA: TrmH family RNA methyltransferase, partial [Kaistella sp.]|nr:TrmH family RNA methyltransferase [Kaistella sp.]